MKKEKGITLVALIITIVVMLILVGVSVNLIVNSNLIGETEKAGATHENAVAAEQKLNPSIGEWKTMNDYLREAGVVEEKHNWQYTDETRGTIKCECEECKAYANNSEGRTLNVGQEINYTVEREKEVGEGEVIASTKISAEKSGASSEQTIKLTEEPIWVVLGMEDKNNNGTNETLLLTTKFPTEDTIELDGMAGYNNCIEEINRMCRELYGKEARGMTIEDINNCVGYTNPKGIYYDNGNRKQTVDNLTTKLSSLPIWNNIKDKHQTPDGKNTEAALGEYLLNGYFYYYDFTGAVEDVINGSYTSYYLASRGVTAWEMRGVVEFTVGGVAFGAAGTYVEYLGLYGTGIRPVVCLTSDIPESGIDTVYPEGGWPDL